MEFFRNDMKTRVRAIIVQDGYLLLIHRVKNGKEYWVFPGGGLEDSDLAPQSGLKRECQEELGVYVSVDSIFTEQVFETQIEIFYICSIISGEIGTGQGPESRCDPRLSGTYELQWILISDLDKKNVQPVEVRDKISISFG